MKNNRWLSLSILCTGFLLIVVDMTIVNVALPSIQRDLGFSQSGLAWVINAYLIAFGGLLLLAGRLGDLFGRKRVYLAGLAIFIAASVLCGLSFSQPMLIAARFIQGIGGAVSSAVLLAMIVSLFPKPDELAKAFGVFSFIASAGAAIGLLAGGLITQAVSWHWIFFVNVPIGLVTAALSIRLLASDRGIGIEKGVDVLGAVLVTVALMLAVYAIVQSSDYGLGSVRTIGLGALALGLLAAFLVRQARARNPILPLRIFASRKLSAANVVQALMSSAFLGFFFVASLDLQRVMGYGPLALLGLGGGLSFPSLTIIAMSDAPPSDSGLASGLLNTTGQVGGALGLAVLATLAGARTLGLVHNGVGATTALAGGYHLAWLIGAGTVVVTLALTMSLLRARTGRSEMELAADEGEAVA